MTNENFALFGGILLGLLILLEVLIMGYYAK
jgi:hypothetical protein